MAKQRQSRFKPRTELERWFQNANYHRTKVELTERCTATHPDHEALSRPIHGERQFWQAWCSKCKARGWDRSGPENPEMSAEHIAKYDEQWKEVTA